MNCQVIIGDARTELARLPAQSVQCCVTSPPYWGLRDYGTEGQLGLEKTPEEYVANMVEVFREVWRVMMDDGTLWLNLGDSYAGSWGNYGGQNRGNGSQREIVSGSKAHQKSYDGLEQWRPPTANPPGLKPKDLVGIPWRVAFALQADGWYLRSDIIWAKPNPMPESVTDRPTKAHEYLFLLTKNERYYYNHEAIKEPYSENTMPRMERGVGVNHKNVNGAPDQTPHTMSRPRLHSKYTGKATKDYGNHGGTGANKRTVWTVATAPYSEAHFATYPPDLIKPCILAGTKTGDTVLDPFGGSGTTGMVALELGRKAILIELNPDYAKLIERRTHITPGLALA